MLVSTPDRINAMLMYTNIITGRTRQCQSSPVYGTFRHVYDNDRYLAGILLAINTPFSDHQRIIRICSSAVVIDDWVTTFQFCTKKTPSALRPIPSRAAPGCRDIFSHQRCKVFINNTHSERGYVQSPTIIAPTGSLCGAKDAEAITCRQTNGLVTMAATADATLNSF